MSISHTEVSEETKTTFDAVMQRLAVCPDALHPEWMRIDHVKLSDNQFQYTRFAAEILAGTLEMKDNSSVRIGGLIHTLDELTAICS